MEASCVFYVKVGMFDQLEQNKICVGTVTTLGIAIRTRQHDIIFKACLMLDACDFLRQTSQDVLSIKECPFFIIQT